MFFILAQELELHQTAQLSLRVVKEADIVAAYESVMEALGQDPKDIFNGASYGRESHHALHRYPG